MIVTVNGFVQSHTQFLYGFLLYICTVLYLHLVAASNDLYLLHITVVLLMLSLNP